MMCFIYDEILSFILIFIVFNCVIHTACLLRRGCNCFGISGIVYHLNCSCIIFFPYINSLLINVCHTLY
jgi:hypothetical protein